jgi:hypothetical protein
MPVQLDFSKAQPINQGVQLDFSKAQPIEKKGFASSFADSSGLTALAHPIDTLLGLPSSIRQMATDSVSNVKQGVADFQKEGLTEKTRRDFGRAVPIVGPVLAQAQGQYDAGDYGGAAGTIAGTVTGLAAPESLKGIKPAAVLEKAAPAIRATGEAAQETAGGIINRTAGMLKSDFKRGANGGRGYLKEGGGVARNMQDLADKAQDLTAKVTNNLDQTYKAADASGKLFSVQEVANAIGKPMQEAASVAAGPGAPAGLAEQIGHLSDTFNDTFNRGIQQGGFTPSEVWDLKKQIAKATNWSNAADVGIKQIKQQQVGALSGLLSDSFPELKQLNQSFMDLKKLGDRAQERANTGSKPLTGHLRDIGAMTGGGLLVGGHEGGLLTAAGIVAGKLARTTAARTAGAAGLYSLGEGLTSVADRIEALKAASQQAATGVSNPVQGQVLTSPAQSIPIIKKRRAVP